MRRSTTVIAPVLASSAMAFLAGCGTQMQRCIDVQGHVADLAFCKFLPPKGQEIASINNNTYRYYYGGSGSYEIGTLVAGGSIVPTANVVYSQTGVTSRKGFGTFFYDHAEDLFFIGAFGLIFVTASAFSS